MLSFRGQDERSALHRLFASHDGASGGGEAIGRLCVCDVRSVMSPARYGFRNPASWPFHRSSTFLAPAGSIACLLLDAIKLQRSHLGT